MSRICVKGLPPYATEEKLKTFFSKAGDISDVKLARTKDGRSRQFAFVGFRSEDAAKEAIAKYNKSFMDTSRLVVEEAKQIGDEYILKTARSRHTKKKMGDGGAEGMKTLKPADAPEAEGSHILPADIANKIKNKEKLEEYMALMKSARSGQVWANDDVAGRTTTAKSTASGPSDAGKSAKNKQDDDANSTDSEEYQVIDVKAEKKKRERSASKDSKASAEPADAKFDSTLSDLDYLRMKMKSNTATTATVTAAEPSNDEDEVGDADDAEEKKGGEVAAAGAGKADSKDEEADVGETGRLFVRNLPYTCNEDELRSFFSKWGRLADVKVPRDTTGKVKGFAYILYVIPMQAVAALAEADGKFFHGRILHVLPAKPEPGSGTAEGPQLSADAKSSFKQKRELEKKAAAGSEFEQQSVWNTLFVRADTAVAAMADKMGVSRGDVLDRDAKNMAVRMALAETQLIAETREFLKEEGVHLAALEAALQPSTDKVNTVKRSDLCIIVKNIPYTVDVNQIRELFGRFGTLTRCVLPPSRAIALVEYADPRIAKKAFSSLAYTRLQRLPLYLEWAPDDLFIGPSKSGAVAQAAPAAASNDATAVSGTKRKREEATSTSEPVAEAEPVEGNTIYVKNVSFDSTEEGLRTMFSAVGPLRSVRIPKRRNTKYISAVATPSQQEWLSMGYAFVEYASRDDAAKALRSLQGRMLDDHALQLKLSANKEQTDSKPAPKRAREAEAVDSTNTSTNTNTKLLVRNLAFEATKADLKELFSAYGTIKTIRIPQKTNGAHRGFGFVDFLTHAEAVAAKDALSSTHLYGRHLVIEWASAASDSTTGVGFNATT